MSAPKRLSMMNRPFIFRQLLDYESNTFTYLLGDPQSKQAVLIDPVLEQVDRDTVLLNELGLDLVFAINTHVHADHITGSGLLKKRFPHCKSVLGLNGNDKAVCDVRVPNGGVLDAGTISLEFRSTPGHTNGCHSIVWSSMGIVFTGDTVLIRGCGRTDFQGGSATLLYKSVWEEIFTLPDDFCIYPAHDYKGRSASTVKEEKLFNPRLTKPVEEFVAIMAGLNLPYPKKIDASVPANLVCGLHEL